MVRMSVIVCVHGSIYITTGGIHNNSGSDCDSVRSIRYFIRFDLFNFFFLLLVLEIGWTFLPLLFRIRSIFGSHMKFHFYLQLSTKSASAFDFEWSIFFSSGSCFDRIFIRICYQLQTNQFQYIGLCVCVCE